MTRGRPSNADDERIRGLIGAYAERLDAGDLDGVAALFVDGTFRSARGGDALVGRERVRSQYDPVILYDDGTPRTKHMLGDIEIEREPGAPTANARCVFTVLQSPPGKSLRAILAGRYHDWFACVDGEWRFTERVVHPDLLGDLSSHMRRGRG